MKAKVEPAALEVAGMGVDTLLTSSLSKEIHLPLMNSSYQVSVLVVASEEFAMVMYMVTEVPAIIFHISRRVVSSSLTNHSQMLAGKMGTKRQVVDPHRSQSLRNNQSKGILEKMVGEEPSHPARGGGIVTPGGEPAPVAHAGTNQQEPCPDQVFIQKVA